MLNKINKQFNQETTNFLPNVNNINARLLRLSRYKIGYFLI